MAAMLREVKMKTLEGGDLTVEVMPTSTIEELKAMLLAMLHEKKRCEDPIERRILKVKVLADGLLVDDDQTVESAGLLNEESEVTVMYHRNEVEAATKRGHPCRGPPPSQHPLFSHGNSYRSLPRLQSGAHSGNP